tara:strand:- start:318 stop:821 length:504 start_codon:yes stop_codon:yes gene_type:complete
MSFRVGIGFDVHKLDQGHSLVLGGVKINHNKGTVAHSDGDVVIHAICDALLGSLSLGDIGLLFPDTNDEFKDIDSKFLLINVLEKIYNKGYKVVNIDISLVLEKPKIQPIINEMRRKISQYSSKINSSVNQISFDDISIKATTNEKIGYVGREEGVACHAVVLINKI